MNTAPIVVSTLERFFAKNPYGVGFVTRLEPFCKNLGPEVAAEVAERLASTSTKFPTLRQCQRALEDAERRISAPVSASKHKSQADLKAENHEAWQRRLAAIRLCRCALGARADREGWLTTLLEFCEERKRLPEGAEIDGLKRRCRDIDDNLHRDPKPVTYGALCNLRTAMLKRAHDDVFGRENACGND